MDKENVVILTGAGFTRNFGGFLGEEVWSKIVNSLSEDQSMRRKFTDELKNGGNFNFEESYSDIIAGDFPDEKKQKLRNIIQKIYGEMDENIIGKMQENYFTEGFFNLLKSKNDIKCFFTLNQDLYLERTQRSDIYWPGVSFPKEIIFDPTQKVKNVELEKKFNKETLFKQSDKTAYIKLHGSYGWLSSDGSPSMIIGMTKEEDIKREPLLEEYLSYFEEILRQGNVKILIIGYGFADKHVNKILFRSVAHHGLKIYILNTEKPNQLFRRLHPQSEKEDLFREFYEEVGPNTTSKERCSIMVWEAIRGYFPYSVKEIVDSPNNPYNTLFKEVEETLSRD